MVVLGHFCCPFYGKLNFSMLGLDQVWGTLVKWCTIQSKLYYGPSIRGCTTEGNLEPVQRIQNCCPRIICKSYDYVNTGEIDYVESLGMQTIRQRRYYVLIVLMFKCIHGLTTHYLCNDVTTIAAVYNYNIRGYENMNLCVLKCSEELCKRSFAYKECLLWNDLSDEVKESGSLNGFKLFFFGQQFSSHFNDILITEYMSILLGSRYSFISVVLICLVQCLFLATTSWFGWNNNIARRTSILIISS